MELNKQEKNIINLATNVAKQVKETSLGISSNGLIGLKNYSGRKLKITKSLVMGGKQYMVEKGTLWEDMIPLCQKNISFSDSDFTKLKG